MHVTIWNEFFHETTQPEIREIYPEGIHSAIAEGLAERLPNASIGTATLDEPEHGLSQTTLENTDVLLWWAHAAHEQVDDQIVERVKQRVLAGMGLVVLHSGHMSKIFRTLMGTTCTLKWRNEGELELVWTVNPTHPIAAGIPSPIVIGQQEMYGEFFDVPVPDELVFVSSFAGGEVFRSGMTYRRGLGKIFYFSPGDQEYPVYYHNDVRNVLANAVRWAAPEREVLHAPTPDNPPVNWFLSAKDSDQSTYHDPSTGAER